MNDTHKLLAALLLVAAGGAASAQGTITRAQVEAELAAAQRNGDVLAPGDVGLPERIVNPAAYPAAPLQPGKTRAQVEAEVAQARRDGTLLLSSGLRERDLAPGMYPPAPMIASTTTRQQVESELAMAIRDGDMMAPGEAEAGLTEFQLNPQRYAAQRAADAVNLQAQQAASAHSRLAALPVQDGAH